MINYLLTISTQAPRLLILAQDEDKGFGFGDIIPAAALIMIITGMMLSGRKKRRNTNLKNLSGQEMIEKNRQLHGVKSDLDELMVEIQQLAKRLGSQLDNKTIHLEKLLQEADQKIDQLKQLQTSDPLTATRSTASLTPPASNDPLSRKVYQLAQQGHSADNIAQQLNEHIGKIELILALAK